MSPLASPLATSFRIARGQLGEIDELARIQPRSWAGFRYELIECFAKARPSRLGLEQDVIAAFERDEARVRNLGRQQASLLIGNACVIPRVHHECRNAHL
jgi:hypothetical protein